MASHILPPLPALLLMLCLLALSVRSLNFPFQKQMKVTLLKTILDLGKFYFWFHTIRSWRVGINSLHKFCCRNDGINIKIKSNVGQIEVFLLVVWHHDACVLPTYTKLQYDKKCDKLFLTHNNSSPLTLWWGKKLEMQFKMYLTFVPSMSSW